MPRAFVSKWDASVKGGGRVHISASPCLGFLEFSSRIIHVGVARRGLGAWTLVRGHCFGFNVIEGRAHLGCSLCFSHSLCSPSLPLTIPPHLPTPLPVDVWRRGRTLKPRGWSW